MGEEGDKREGRKAKDLGSEMVADNVRWRAHYLAWDKRYNVVRHGPSVSWEASLVAAAAVLLAAGGAYRSRDKCFARWDRIAQ